MSDEKPRKKPRVRRRKKDAEPAVEDQPERDEAGGSAGGDEAAPEAAGAGVEEAESAVASGEEASDEVEPVEEPRAVEPDEEPEAVEPDEEPEAVEPDEEPEGVEPDEAEPAEVEAGEAEPERPRRRRRGAAETTTSSSKSRVEQARPAPRDERGAVHVRAQAKYVRSAPRKARLVMDHIRGKRVADARAILRHTPRAAAADVSKLLESAVANAENNFELDPEELKVGRAYVDEGPTIKRYRPRALGRATSINKRTSHMTISLTEVEPADIAAGPAKARRRQPAKRGERS